jgi:hypothetical protein
MATMFKGGGETPWYGQTPSWLNPPDPMQAVSMALVTHTNPVTGETWTAPNGGYTLNMPTSTAPAPMLGGNIQTGGAPSNGMLGALGGLAADQNLINSTLTLHLLPTQALTTPLTGLAFLVV